MSAGQRFKFQGSTIAILSAWSFDSPAIAISAITKANPAVVTETAHGRATGEVIRLSSVGGMTELEDGVFVIEKVDANSYKLVDVDSSGYGTYTSGALVENATFSNFCELKGYNRQGGSSPELDATSLCSVAAEFELGLPDFGTTQLDYNFAPQTAIQLALAAADASKDTIGVKIILPGAGGSMVQLGMVQQTSEQAAVNGMWTASCTLRNTGSRYDFVTA